MPTAVPLTYLAQAAAAAFLAGLLILMLRRPAERWGLVNRLTAPGQALDGARALARTIAANGPLAVQLSKQVVAQAQGWPADEVWARQRAVLEQVICSQDAREGALAFSEKRAPVWSGR